jgi:DNA-directed RNA polymerase specialized sigma subunit
MSALTLQDLIVTQGLPLVDRLARKYARRTNIGFDVSDFFDTGQAVLVEVAPAYDAREPVKFTTYLYPYVNGAMQDAVRRKQFEMSALELIGAEVDREARRYASTRSDEFEVVFDSPEVCLAHLGADLSEMALGLAAEAAAATIRLMRQGTEEHLGDLAQGLVGRHGDVG